VIGAIMVLLTRMYYSSFVLLAAGELTAELKAGSGRVDRRGTSESISGWRGAAMITQRR
jgi:uncharacterized BrkB/YihY/UPF0761 family membrane protein